MQSTRQKILDHLRRHGEATVRDLAAPLQLTPTGIRQHLAILVHEGLASIQETRGKIGRPASNRYRKPETPSSPATTMTCRTSSSSRSGFLPAVKASRPY